MYACFRRSPFWSQFVIKPEMKPPSDGLMRESLANALANHLVLQWISSLFIVAPLLSAAGVLEHLTAPASAARYDVSSLWEHAYRIGVCVLLEDTCFYWIHRLFHQKWLYAKVHKRHHSFVTNHPVAAEHAHVVESLLGNLGPFLVGVMALGLHGTTFLLWTWLRIAESVDGHSGFKLPRPLLLLFSPLSLLCDRERHDFHHSHGGGTADEITIRIAYRRLLADDCGHSPHPCQPPNFLQYTETRKDSPMRP